MKIKLNDFTLEITGINGEIKESPQLVMNNWLSRKILMGVFIIVMIYNFCYVFIDEKSYDREFTLKLMFVIIPDIISVIMAYVFLIALPKRKIQFNGINNIPILAMIILQLEFNIMNYEYDKINH